MEQLGAHKKDFHEILYLHIFRKSVENIQISLKSDKNKSTSNKDQNTLTIISPSVFLIMRNVSYRSCREYQHAFHVLELFLENRAVLDNVEKYCRAGEATDDNMRHAHFVLDT
jgi:hypothetical protein